MWMVTKSYYKWNQDVNLKKLVQYQGKIENFRTMGNSSYGDSINYCISIDQSGVGELVELASTRGRKVNKKLKLGICGEHGGDPKSIDFCSRIGLDYVSCSPFRVPVARLSAAQAELSK